MKQSIRHYLPVVLLMVAIVAVSAVLTVFTGVVGTPNTRRTVVTTTYPLYLAVTAILGDTDTLAVENLADTAVGCMHDMQLSPANRITLQNAALVVLNGAGAEGFLAEALAALPELPTVDTSAACALLTSCHSHDHAHDAADGAAQAHTPNEHVWVSPTRYAEQITAAAAALCALDPANAPAYAANGRAYRERVLAVGDRLRQVAAILPSKNCIIFHDSLAYLADDLGLTVTVSIHTGEESGVAAQDLAQAQAALAADPQALVLYDSQYTVRYAAVDDAAADNRVLAMDTAVVGHGRADDWLRAMEQNITRLEGAV